DRGDDGPGSSKVTSRSCNRSFAWHRYWLRGWTSIVRHTYLGAQLAQSLLPGRSTVIGRFGNASGRNTPAAPDGYNGRLGIVVASATRILRLDPDSKSRQSAARHGPRGARWWPASNRNCDRCQYRSR